MTIRLFCNATGKHALACLDRLRELSGDEIESVTGLGDVNADVVAPSLTQMKASRGGGRPVFQGPAHQGPDLSLLARPDFLQAMQATVEHLRRTVPGYRYGPQNLVNLQDYLDYYHILSDIMAQKLIAARSSHVLFFGLPEQVFDRVLYDTAQALGVKTVILSQSPFPNLVFSMRRIEDLGAFDPDAVTAPLFPVDPATATGPHPPGEAVKANFLQGLGHFLSYVLAPKPLWAFNPVYLARTMTRMQRLYGRFPNWRDPFARFFGESAFGYFEHLLEAEKQAVDLGRMFVYAPLPGKTTCASGDRDPVLAIEDLSLVLPQDWLIYVQESPGLGASARGPMVFHRLKRIPQVRFVPRQTDPQHLIKRSQFVADCAQNIGLEAIRNGKPAVVFGWTWFQHLPGVFAFSPAMDPLTVAATVIDPEGLRRAVGVLVARGHDGQTVPDGQNMPVDLDAVRNADVVAQAALGLLRGDTGFTFGA